MKNITLDQTTVLQPHSDGTDGALDAAAPFSPESSAKRSKAVVLRPAQADNSQVRMPFESAISLSRDCLVK